MAAPGKKDYYEVLGVGRDASADEIKKAYRKLTRQHHPDANKGDPSAEEKYKEINEAYEVLGDPEKRAQFDQFGFVGDMPPGNGFGGYGGGFQDMDLGDLFGDLFGGSFGRQGRQRSDPNAPRRGNDLEYAASVTLEEAFRGVTKKVEIPRLETCDRCHGDGSEPGSTPETCKTCGGTGQMQQVMNTPFGQMAQVTTCSACRGTGKIINNPCRECRGQGRVRKKHSVEVKIPRGVDTGVRLRVSSQGESGINGGPSGDLYLLIEVKSDSRFQRRGDDLNTTVDISYPQAALGSEIKIATFDGTENLQIPAGTQPGSKLRIKGRGMPRLRGGFGDMNILVRVTVSKNPSNQEKELLLKLAEEMGVSVKKPKGGLFDKFKDNKKNSEG